jgi:hypothetical protein
MARVQEVEAAVREDDAGAGGAPRRQRGLEGGKVGSHLGE